MADPKTDINESLCCIALRYIDKFPKGSVDDFVNLIVPPVEGEPLEWKQCLENIEVGIIKHELYKDAYKGNEDWIRGSYYSARKIRSALKIKLKDYIISRVYKSQDSKAYKIKELATTAIKNWANVYDKTNKTWSPGLISKLKSDKINISDIILIKSNSKIYQDLIKKIAQTDSIKWDDVDKNPKILADLLTPKLYNELMNRAWKDKEIYGVSLKKIIAKNVPIKIINYESHSSANLNNYTDEFAFLISTLVSAAKNSTTFHQFNDIIKNTIDLEPVEFTSTDRLDVKYKFNIPTKTGIKKYDYTCWTNFGGGTNSVYFQQEGSGSASGEGGITLSYFFTLVKKIPKLKTFVKDIKEKRKKYFIDSCEKYGIDFNSINSKMGSSALTSGVYNNILYKSSDFKKLVHVLLTGKEPTKDSEVIFPETYKSFKNQTGSGVNVKYTLQEDDKTVQKTMKLNDLKYIECLEDFFKSYVDFLSANNNQMGKYFGVSSTTLKSIETQNKNIKNEYDKKFSTLVLKKKLELLSEEQKQLSPKERIKGKTAEETKKLKEESAKKFKLAKKIMDDFVKEAKMHSESKRKKIEQTYKKSFALLANAEFGYMYSNHAEKINDLVKKEVLLSLYAAASGRGYIIFNGKQFKIDDYFEKDIKGSPFLKVGM